VKKWDCIAAQKMCIEAGEEYPFKKTFWVLDFTEEGNARNFIKQLKYNDDWKDLVSASFLAEKWMCLSHRYWHHDQVRLRREMEEMDEDVVKMVAGTMSLTIKLVGRLLGLLWDGVASIFTYGKSKSDKTTSREKCEEFALKKL